MKVGSLFSGIGGIDLGLKWAGMETIWFVENDKYCQKILAKHWPEVPCYGDIKTVDFRTLPRPDLLCGGFPCQPFSVAGKRKGTTDDRWLWPEFYRAICETKPNWILVENVPGLLSIDSGRIFGGILRDLAEIGYDAEWDCLQTGRLFGHKRERIFIISYINSQGLQTPRKYKKTERTQKSIFMEPTFATIYWGIPAPGVLRNVHGISKRMDRIKSLGNAVVPQVAQWIGERILEAEKTQ